jgi:hypothetical protein
MLLTGSVDQRHGASVLICRRIDVVGFGFVRLRFKRFKQTIFASQFPVPVAGPRLSSVRSGLHWQRFAAENCMPACNW